MNGNMCNDPSSYSRRHIYSAHNDAQAFRCGAPKKNPAYRSIKRFHNNDSDATAAKDTNALKKTYDSVVSFVCNKQSINQMINNAAEWLEVDDKALRVEGTKKKVPVKLITGVIVVATSLMLVVSGAVISSKANMELYASENKLEELRAKSAELDEALEIKNDLVYIEDVARNKLGMIEREYGTVMYIDNEVGDKVEIHEKTTDTSAFYALLNALGFFGE